MFCGYLFIFIFNSVRSESKLYTGKFADIYFHVKIQNIIFLAIVAIAS